MAEDRMALLETIRKAAGDGDVDFLREGVKVLAEAVMEAEVTELTGVPKGERAPERRRTHRNGYRERRWDTRAGSIGLAPVYENAEHRFPWMSEQVSMRKEKNFFETRPTEYRTGGALSWDD